MQGRLSSGPSAPLPQEPPVSGPATAAGELPSTDEISGVLREILADPEFATFDAPVANPFLNALVSRLTALLEWMMELFDRAPGLATALAVLIPALALLAAGLIVVRRRRGAVRRTDGGAGFDAEEAPVTRGEWLRLASRQAGEGRLRPAATALYQGFLLTLTQHGTLAFHPSKTPGDYALEIGRTHSGAAQLSAGGRFLNSFQGFSFGQDDPSSDGYADLARLAREAGCPAGGAHEEGGGDDPAGESVVRAGEGGAA